MDKQIFLHLRVTINEMQSVFGSEKTYHAVLMIPEEETIAQSLEVMVQQKGSRHDLGTVFQYLEIVF